MILSDKTRGSVLGLLVLLLLVVLEMSKEKHFIRKWTLIGILVLSNIAVLSILAVYVYAQIKVAPLMGRGPSIGEFLQPYVNAIFQIGIVGIVGLLLTAMYWWWVESGKKPDHSDTDRRRVVQISLMLVPSWLMIIYFVAKVITF